MHKNKSYNSLIGILALVVCLLTTSVGTISNQKNYDLSLNKGIIFSYIDSTQNNNSFSQKDSTPTADFKFLITHIRTFFFDDNQIITENMQYIGKQRVSMALFAYMNSYSNYRILHPPLEKLCTFLI